MKEVIRVAVSGSRTITNKAFVFSTLDFYLARLLEEYEVILVHGGAKGVDESCELWAKSKGIETEIYLPDYKQYGKGATHIRNKQIVDNSDYLIAITTGSNGTASTIKFAEKRGIKIKIIQYGRE